MKSDHTAYTRQLAVFSASVAVATLFGGTSAFAIESNAFNYTTAKTGYYGISNLAMAAGSSNLDPNGGFINPSENGGLAMTGAIPQCFNTAVNLPNGAVVKTLVVYFRGLDEEDVTIKLVRQKLSDGTEDLIANKAFTDFSGNRVSQNAPVNASFATVANAQYNYGFQVCIDPGGEFHGARIGYQYTSAGD